MKEMGPPRYSEEKINDFETSRRVFMVRAQLMAEENKTDINNVVYTYALTTGKYVEKNINNERMLERIYSDDLDNDLFWEITENILKKEAAEKLASIDFLTGLPNRRSMEKKLNDFSERHERLKSSFSLILLDLDKFKDINDLYGHQTGDKVLQRVAEEMRKHIGLNDLPFRFGGEEMGVIVDGTLDRAGILAGLIRKSISKLNPVDLDPKMIRPISASFGISGYIHKEGQPITESTQNMFDEADKALYQAKQSGRNRVQSSEEPS